MRKISLIALSWSQCSLIGPFHHILHYKVGSCTSRVKNISDSSSIQGFEKCMKSR